MDCWFFSWSPRIGALTAQIQGVGVRWDRPAEAVLGQKHLARQGLLDLEGMQPDATSIKASSALQACLRSIASKAAELLPQASKLPLAVQDARLGLETGIIVRLAHKLIALLMIRDPLSERVHLTRLDAMLQAAHGAATTLAARLVQPSASPRPGEKR